MRLTSFLREYYGISDDEASFFIIIRYKYEKRFHEQKKCTHCAHSYENYQKDQHNAVCNRCNPKYCAQQTSLHNPVCEDQFFLCDHKAAGCQYVIPITTADETKKQLLQLHLDYFCPVSKIEHDILKYQLRPFSEKGCGFFTEYCNDPLVARAKIARHLNDSCPYMLTKCKNEECVEYVSRKLLGNHMDACQFSKFKCNYCKEFFHNIRDHIMYECENTHCKNAGKGCNFFSTDQSVFMKHEMECDIILCPYCSEYIQNKSFSLHIQKECRETRCKNAKYGCGFSCTDKTRLSQHGNKCKPEKFAEVCKHCGLSTDIIDDHIQYECDKTHCENVANGCDFFSLSKEDLVVHENACNGQKYPYCLKYVQNQRDHIQNECSGIRCKNIAYGCEFCSMGKAKLLEHERICTAENVVFICEFCKEQYHDKMSLKSHQLLKSPNNMCQSRSYKKRYFSLNAMIEHNKQCSCSGC